jgi:signal transduction histidine kinase
MTDTAADDMIRFNEAIDQVLSESVITYSKHLAVVRDTFLAILEHDLRSLLASMIMAGDYLTQPSVGNDLTLQIGLRVRRSGATMSAMVNDLLEYARAQLDGHLPIAREQVDVTEICGAAIDDATAAHPKCPFEVDACGDSIGNFDSVRLQQVFSNLLNNAAQYLRADRPVTISVEGSPKAILVKVRNFGPVIPPVELKSVFEPLVQLPVAEQQHGRPATSLGLGLFIAREITLPYGCTISAGSDEDSGTTFSVKSAKSVVARSTD